MSAVRRLIGAWVLCALCLFAPRRVLACGCCDYPGVVKAVGWSADGESILFDQMSGAGCENTRSQAALRRGDQYRACFAGTKEPYEYACGKRAKGPELSLKATDYPGVVRAIQAGHLRASVRVIEGTNPTLHAVDVRVFAGGTWRALFSGRVFEWSSVGPGDPPAGGWERNLEVVAALPTPDGTRAVLVIANFDGSPGIGSYGVSLVWVDLPASVGVAAGAASEFESLPVYDMKQAPKYLDPIAPGPGRIAVPAAVASEEHPFAPGPNSWNQRGLAAHRKGDFAASSRLFTHALGNDAEDPFPRYNLACAYARLGMPERAMAELSILAGLRKCSKCAERLVRARSDEDFEGLHSRADFRSLVCGDAGDCFARKTAAPADQVGSPRPVGAAPSASGAPPPVPPAAASGKPTCHCELAPSGGSEGASFVAVLVALTAVRRRRSRPRMRLLVLLLETWEFAEIWASDRRLARREPNVWSRGILLLKSACTGLAGGPVARDDP